MKKRLLAAALAVVIILQLAVLSGCSASSRTSSESTTNGATTDEYSGINDNPSSSSAASTADSSKSTSSGVSSSNVSSSDSARKIIMSAELTLQTTSYDKSTSKLESLVTQYGGFIQNSSTQGMGVNESDDARSANYMVRIPSDKLNDFISSIGSVGKVVQKSVKGEDISKQYNDTETQLETLKAERKRILEILNKTTNMTDVIAIEQRLSDLETQINQITGEIKQWDSLVDLSTVTITINEVKLLSAKKDDFGSQLSNTFKSSLNALLNTLKTMVAIIVALLPFAIVFGGIALIIVLIIKKTSKRNKKRTEQPKEPPSNDDKQ